MTSLENMEYLFHSCMTEPLVPVGVQDQTTYVFD